MHLSTLENKLIGFVPSSEKLDRDIIQSLQKPASKNPFFQAIEKKWCWLMDESQLN